MSSDFANAAIPFVGGIIGGGIFFAIGGTAFFGSAGYLIGSYIGSSVVGKRTGDRFSAAKDLANFPTNQEGLPVRIFFGYNKISGLHIINDPRDGFKTIVQKESSGGSGGSSTVVTGISYRTNLAYLIGHGPIDSVEEIRIGDEVIWEGPLSNSWPVESTLSTDRGAIQFNFGSGCGETNAENNYIKSKFDVLSVGQTYYSRLNGFSFITMNRFNLKSAPTVPNIEIVCKRKPQSTVGELNNLIGNDANPAGIILDLMQNPCYGLAIPNAYINRAAFRRVGQILAAAEEGISLVVDSPTELFNYIDAILEHINGFMYIDEMGRLSIKLLREDEIPDSNQYVNINEDHLIPGTLIESNTSNAALSTHINIQYTDASANFAVRTVTLMNGAALNHQKIPKVEQINLSFYTTKAAATRAGNRILTQKSNPVRTVQFETNLRPGANLWIGKHIRLNLTSRDETIIAIVTNIEHTDLEEGTIRVEAIEDIIATATDLSFAVPPDTTTSNTEALVCFDRARAYELPSGLNPYFSITPRLIFAVGQSPMNTVEQFNVWAERNTGGGYVQVWEQNVMVPAGSLLTTLPSATANEEDATDVFYVSLDGFNDDAVGSVSTASWQADYQIMLVDDELISIKTINPVASPAHHDSAVTPFGGATNVYKITGTRRGVLGSTPDAHTEGTNIYFIRTIVNQIFEDAQMEDGSTWSLKYQAQRGAIGSDITGCDAESFTFKSV